MPVNRLMMRMGLPMILSMALQAVYNIVDSFFVGQYSANSLTALSVIYPLQLIIIALAVGTGVGVNTYMARQYAQKFQQKAEEAAGTGMVLEFMTWLIFAVLAAVFMRPYVMTSAKSPEAIEDAVIYGRIVCIGSIGAFLEGNWTKVHQSRGNMRRPMIAQTVGALTNIVLDPIMIFGLLGCPAMGVTGAAVATVIGQCVAAVVAFTCNHKFNTEIKIRFQGFRPDIKIIGTIYAIGVPSIIMQSIGSVMTYSMNRILIAFSSTATAVFGVYFKLQSFFFMPVFGLNNGITPIIAFNYGAQNRKRMIKTIKLSLITAFCLTFVGFLSFELIPQVLLGMFNASEDMLAIGIPALRIIGVHYLIAWFCIICGTVFQALGKAVYSMIVSILRQLVVLIPVAYLLSRIGGLHVVWWCFPIAEVASLVVSLTFLFSVNRQIISKIPDGSDIL